MLAQSAAHMVAREAMAMKLEVRACVVVCVLLPP
jgi:hypothetical protein